MKWIDDTAAKSDARSLLLATVVLSIIATEPRWRNLFPFLSSFDRPLLQPEAGYFFELCAGLLLCVALSMWFFRQRIKIATEAVHHYPVIFFGSTNYRWSDVRAWGYQTALEPDEGGNLHPMNRLYVLLKNGRTIHEPAFAEKGIADALLRNIGSPTDRNLNP